LAALGTADRIAARYSIPPISSSNCCLINSSRTIIASIGRLASYSFFRILNKIE